MPIKKYLIVGHLNEIYTDELSSVYKIYEALELYNTNFFQNFDTLPEAQSNMAELLKEKKLISPGIVELEFDSLEDYDKKIREVINSFKMKKKLITGGWQSFPFIKQIFIKGFSISFNNLRSGDHEKSHVRELNYDSNNSSALQLTQPPLLYLDQVHPELRYLLFMDYKLFDYRFENWRHYNAREPKGNGCYADLFNGASHLSDDFLRSQMNRQNKIDVTLEEIKKLHRILSDSIYHNSTFDGRGLIRPNYSTFDLKQDFTTFEGLKEFLLRIRNDNNPNGFRLGRLKKLKVVSTFCEKMSELIRSNHFSEKEGYSVENYLADLHQKAIRATYDELINRKIDIPYQKIEEIVDHYLKDFRPEEIKKDNYYLHNLAYKYELLIKTTSKDLIQSEYDLELSYSREHAFAAAGENIENSAKNISRYSDQEIEELAASLYQEIKEIGSIDVFTPESSLAKEWAQKVIATYNADIQTSNNIEDTIKIIDNLVHELEILHLFQDVNCRTNYLLMNFLFLENQLKWSTEYNPNRLDAYDSSQRIEQHKQGMIRTDYIIDHPEELLIKNATIDENFASVISNNNQILDYERISQPLMDKIEEYKSKFKQFLTSIQETYEKLSHTSRDTLFSVNKSSSNIRSFGKALGELGVDYDLRRFYKKVQNIKLTSDMQRDIRKIENFTGINRDSFLPPPSKTLRARFLEKIRGDK